MKMEEKKKSNKLPDEPSKGKIGIVTLYGNSNYGNKLQNYAVQELYKEHGYEAETIVCRRKSWKRTIKNALRWFDIPEKRREIALTDFSKKYLQVKKIESRSGLIDASIAEEYEFFSVGSDQVWNPLIRKKEKYNFFLRFAKQNQRICLSPSISTDSIPGECLREYINGMEGFPYLSCREEEGTELIREVTKKNCYHTIDPTLAISKEKWLSFEEKCEAQKPYVLLFFLGDINDQTQRLIDTIRNKFGLTVICPSDKHSSYYCINPNQFVYLIDHAEIVLTDSFHATAFSINLNTPFYVFNRRSSQTVSEKMSSRIVSLTRNAGLFDRYITDLNSCNPNLTCDFSTANEYLNKARIEIEQYITKCLNQKNIMPLKLPEKQCSGCGTCSLVCPSASIAMKRDCDGFMRPSVSLNSCINCGKCVQKCPVLQKKEVGSIKEVYAAFNRDETEVKKSTSGAIFPLLAEHILSKNGIVVGASFDDKLHVRHTIAASKKEMNDQRFAKYVQSEAHAVFYAIKSYLEEGRFVLFTGTPCQVAGLKSFLDKQYNTLFTVDCSCHGVPSPGLWEKWVAEFEEMHGCKINKVNFRVQSGQNWNQYNVVYYTDKGKFSYAKDDDMYLKAFRQNLSLRPSCFDCHFKGWERGADLSVGDFWGIESVCPEMTHNSGTSMILVHTGRGQTLLDLVADRLAIKKIEINKAETVNDATWKSVVSSPNRETFMTRLYNESVSASVKHCQNKKKHIIKRAVTKVKVVAIRVQAEISRK
ncbi:polysaccharide pyruvyl transferase family protein [Oscillospiraceae bacterium LCP21S3_A1]